MKYRIVRSIAVMFFPLYMQAQNLELGIEATISVKGQAFLVMNDIGFHNKGNFDAGTGTVIFSGNKPLSFISGNTGTVFYNIKIDKSANDVQLNTGISLINKLQMSSGNLQLNNNNIDLDANSPGITGESETSRITGTNGGVIRITKLLNAPSGENPAGLGLVITTATNLGTTTISRGHKQQTSANVGLSILRYYDITPAVSTGLNATLRFNYFDTELAGRNESELNLWTSSDGGITWSPSGRNATDATANWVEKNSIDHFSRFTLASTINNPLPISLLYFRGIMVNNKARLYWATGQEFNNDHFELERSGNGSLYNQLATIPGKGNSTTTQEYEHIDPSPMNGVNYYRLKQVDKDQHFKYSNIVVLNTANNSNSLVKIYPLPAQDKLTIVLFSDREKDCQLSLYDQLGHLMENKSIHCRNGINTIDWNLARYAAGTYYLQFENTDLQSAKIIKE